MAYIIVADIEGAKKKQGLEAAQGRYRAWFISIPYFQMYKTTVDNILQIDGNGDCIVTA